MIPGNADQKNVRNELERMPSFLLNHIVHQYHQRVQARLKSVGVSTLKMRVIISLKIFGELTVNELCGYAIAEQPTMSRALDGLEKQGLVDRQISQRDSRLRLVTLTEAGGIVFERIYPEILGINAMMTEGLSERQREDLLSALTVVLENLRRS